MNPDHVPEPADGLENPRVPAHDPEPAPAPASAPDPAPDPALQGVAELLAQARAGIVRATPADLPARMAAGAWVIDLRTPWTRTTEGHIPGALVIEHTVHLWRLDPRSESRMDEGPGLEDELVVVCNEGYASSLAARTLREIGFVRATDLDGGFRAWAAAGLPVEPEPTRYVT